MLDMTSLLQFGQRTLTDESRNDLVTTSCNKHTCSSEMIIMENRSQRVQGLIDQVILDVFFSVT